MNIVRIPRRTKRSSKKILEDKLDADYSDGLTITCALWDGDTFIIDKYELNENKPDWRGKMKAHEAARQSTVLRLVGHYNLDSNDFPQMEDYYKKVDGLPSRANRAAGQAMDHISEADFITIGAQIMSQMEGATSRLGNVVGEIMNMPSKIMGTIGNFMGQPQMGEMMPDMSGGFGLAKRRLTASERAARRRLQALLELTQRHNH